MHISLMTGIRTVNGVSGHSPKGGWPAEDPSVVKANEWIQKISNSSIHLITDNKHKHYTLCEINDEDADSTKINSINGKLSES